MAGRQLSDGEIKQLLAYEHNVSINVAFKSRPAFDKQQTIQILNAVTEDKVITEDGKWKITYRKSGTEFFVKPTRGFVPCGHFNREAVMERLSL